MKTPRGRCIKALSTLGALALAAMLLPSCAAVLGAIEDRLPPPSEVEGGIQFRFQAPSARQVTLAGTFNNWGGTQTGRYDPDIDPMRDPDGDGVWTIVKALPPGRYEYKFVLDGAVRWEEDPTNPETVDDGYGGVNSVLVVPPTVSYEYEAVTGTVTRTGATREAVAERERAPDAVEVDIEVEFPDASEVYIAGDFNGWDSESDRLEEVGDDVFRISLSLQPGTYEYKFVVDGDWKEDPGNPDTVPDPYGGVNSVLTVE